MEIVLGTDNQRLVLWDSLNLISPLARDLDARLDGFSTGVHGQDHVITKELGDELGEPGKHIVVEGAGAEGQPRRLVAKRSYQLGVAMALVDGGVGGQEVEVVVALGIPGGGSLGTREDDREGVVVMRSEIMLLLDSFLSRRGVVAGSTSRTHGGDDVVCGAEQRKRRE